MVVGSQILVPEQSIGNQSINQYIYIYIYIYKKRPHVEKYKILPSDVSYAKRIEIFSR